MYKVYILTETGMLIEYFDELTKAMIRARKASDNGCRYRVQVKTPFGWDDV